MPELEKWFEQGHRISRFKTFPLNTIIFTCCLLACTACDSEKEHHPQVSGNDNCGLDYYAAQAIGSAVSVSSPKATDNSKPRCEIKDNVLAHEQSFEEIVARANCLACHSPDNKMGSPTWHDVAKKYRSDHEEAMHHLQHKIAHGGSGAWGKMDMPPYPDLSEADIRILARGILASNAGNSISNSKGK